MRRLLTGGVLLTSLVAGVPLRGQVSQAADRKDDSAFDVTSVKANTSGDTGIGGESHDGQFRITNVPLRILMRQAFERWQEKDVIGGPAWLDTDRWNIVAKADQPGPIRPRLRTLLSDRFKLITHRETKAIPIYALVIARRDGKLGPFLRPSTDESPIRMGPGLFKGHARIAMLVEGVLGRAVQRIVVDRTGLDGIYDIDLHWTPDSPSDSSDALSIFTALHEQLGLKLESTKAPVDILVIDHVEKPTEN